MYNIAACAIREVPSSKSRITDRCDHENMSKFISPAFNIQLKIDREVSGDFVATNRHNHNHPA